MKAKELRKQADYELLQALNQLQQQLLDLKLQRAVKQLDNPMKMRLTRRDIARIKTILKERGIVV